MKRLFTYILITSLLAAFFAACEDYTDDYPVPPASTVAGFELISSREFVPPDTITFYNRSVIPDRAGEAQFLWDFGDGESLLTTDSVITHVYDTIGAYTVKLTLTTSAGDTSTASKSFEMKDLLLGDTLLFQDFENISLIPDNWVLENLDGNTPNSTYAPTLADSAWVVRPTTKMDGKVAYAVSYYDDVPCYADDWMILDKISLGANTVMAWDAFSFTSSGDYPDDYGIYVSTTDQTSDACLAEGILLKIDDESWSETADTPGEGLQRRRLYFKEYGYQNQDVYIAFRLMTPDPGGSSLGIDNITIIELN